MLTYNQYRKSLQNHQKQVKDLMDLGPELPKVQLSSTGEVYLWDPGTGVHQIVIHHGHFPTHLTRYEAITLRDFLVSLDLDGVDNSP